MNLMIGLLYIRYMRKILYSINSYTPSFYLYFITKASILVSSSSALKLVGFFEESYSSDEDSSISDLTFNFFNACAHSL